MSMWFLERSQRDDAMAEKTHRPGPGDCRVYSSLEKAMQRRPTLQKRGPHKNSLPIEDKSFGARVSGQEDVKKLIWPKSKLMQNVCRRPSDRLLGILARLFLEPKFPHTNFLISSHLPDEITPKCMWRSSRIQVIRGNFVCPKLLLIVFRGSSLQEWFSWPD
jgi:hypothetical protein